MLREIGRTASQGELAERLKSLLKGDILLVVIVAGGIALRIRQFTAHISFGNDEAALARNIVERGFGGLAQPLGFNQGAPILFLFIQKAIVSVLGNKDMVLELFPLAAGLLALYLMARIARRQLGAAGLIGVLALALAFWPTWYSANPKQYSSDLMLMLLLVALSDGCIRDEARPGDFIALGVAGAVSIWLSHPAAFVLAGIGMVIAARQLAARDRRRLGWSVAMGGLWVAAFAGFYLISLRRMTADPYLTKYWQGAFMPMPPWSHPAWFIEAFKSLLDEAASRSDASVAITWLPMILIGSASLLIRKRSLAFILLLPFVFALAASGLQKYPFQQRLLLFLVPAVYLLVAEGFSRVYGWVAKWNRVAGLIVCAVLLVLVMRPLAVSAKRNFVNPAPRWNMQPVVAYMARNWQAGDMVFVSGGGETFQYYAEQYGLRPAAVVVQNSHRIARFYEYMRAMDGLAGRGRVWVVFAYFEEQSGQHQRYVKYLSRRAQIVSSFRLGFARAYLCEFAQ